MATDTVLNELILQEVTQAEYEQLVKDNLLDENRVYLTPDNSLKGSLLDFKWADHLLDDISWLRADTFSWQSGDVYIAAYNHLAADFATRKYVTWYGFHNEGRGTVYLLSPTPSVGDLVVSLGRDPITNEQITLIIGNVTAFDSNSGVMTVNGYDYTYVEMTANGPSVDTVGGTSVLYYATADKHKICLPDQEDKVLELYNKTGVAWYYILDTENKQFKLPRSKHNKYADTVPVVGNGKTLGLTDGVSTFGIAGSNNSLSAAGSYIARSGNDTLLNVGEQINGWTGATANGKTIGVTTTPEKSGLIAPQEQDTDQYKYLYFYVGNFERDAVEQTAGVTTEMLNSKADVDLSNINASQAAKDTITGWVVPDYSAGVTISTNTDFVCPMHGVIAGEVSAASGGYCQIKVNGIVIMPVGSENNQRCRGPFYAQVQKGDVVYILTAGNANIPQSNFYPLKGVN